MENFPHEKGGENLSPSALQIDEMYNFDVSSHFMPFCCKTSLLCDLRCFVVKSVLSRFTRPGVEKIVPKILSVEKKGQISGMVLPEAKFKNKWTLFFDLSER